MSTSEMGAKIENAFRNIGVEENAKWGFRRPALEFKVYDFAFGNPSSVGPHNVDAFVANRKERHRIIEEFLNDGWWLTDKIICPPSVMLIFSRAKETEENERKQ